MTRARNISQLASDYPFVSLAENDTTPSVVGGKNFITANTGSTKIAQFTDGYVGQEIIVIVEDGFTTFDFTTSGLRGNNGVDLTPALHDAIKATYDGTYWYCMVIQA